MICNKLKGFYSVRNNTFAQVNSKFKQWNSCIGHIKWVSNKNFKYDYIISHLFSYTTLRFDYHP